VRERQNLILKKVQLLEPFKILFFNKNLESFKAPKKRQKSSKKLIDVTNISGI
jgi:hypothetical protein